MSLKTGLLLLGELRTGENLFRRKMGPLWPIEVSNPAEVRAGSAGAMMNCAERRRMPK